VTTRETHASKRHRPGLAETEDAIAYIWRDDVVFASYLKEFEVADPKYVARLSGSAVVPPGEQALKLPSRFVRSALERHRWPLGRLLDARSGRRRPIVDAPNAILILAGDNTTETEIRQIFARALRGLKKQQLQHGGKPRKRRKRVDYRRERALLFLWLNSTKQFGRPLGANKIARLWMNLTSEWSAHRKRTAGDPRSLRMLPQATRAWREWAAAHPSADGIEDLDRDGVRAVLQSVEPAPSPRPSAPIHVS
jgi:hypothetical protein